MLSTFAIDALAGADRVGPDRIVHSDSTWDKVGKHQGLDVGARCDHAELFAGGMCREQVLSQSRRIRLRCNQFFDGRKMEHLVDQHICAISELDEIFRGSRVPRNHDRAVGAVEPVSKSRNDRRMVDERARHLDPIVLHHEPRS